HAPVPKLLRAHPRPWRGPGVKNVDQFPPVEIGLVRSTIAAPGIAAILPPPLRKGNLSARTTRSKNRRRKLPSQRKIISPLSARLIVATPRSLQVRLSTNQFCVLWRSRGFH